MRSPARRPKTGAERTASHRARMKAAGFVPRTIWVPDLKNPEVRTRIERASRAIAKSEARDAEITTFFEHFEEWPENVPEIVWHRQ